MTGAASIDHAESIETPGVTALDINAEISDVQPAEYTVTDADADNVVTDAADVKWSLSGADSSKFDIVGTN